VDNGFIVIHGKRPGSPQANCPQIHSLFWFRRGSSQSPGVRSPSSSMERRVDCFSEPERLPGLI